jgi:diaminopimelate epimerase
MTISSINTGVPHMVVTVDDLETVDVIETGRELRYHAESAPAGTNVNFLTFTTEEGLVKIRTYERGVEDETLACGTGAIACALIAAMNKDLSSPVRVKTRSGGILTIHFQGSKGEYSQIFLQGDARVVYKGEFGKEAWEYGFEAGSK